MMDLDAWDAAMQEEARAWEEQREALRKAGVEAKERAAREEAEREAKIGPLISALREAGIRMSVYGCGCCGSPRVSYSLPDGTEMEEEDNFGFEMARYA